MKNKKMMILGTGIISLITGILFFVFKANVQTYTVTIVGSLIVLLGVLKFMNNIKYCSNNILRNITIIELLILVGFGLLVIFQRGNSKYINYFMGIPLYVTALSYFWQLNTRSGYKVRVRSFALNVMLITVGSNLLLSDFNVNKLLVQLATVLTVYGSVVVLYFIANKLLKKA